MCKECINGNSSTGVIKKHRINVYRKATDKYLDLAWLANDPRWQWNEKDKKNYWESLREKYPILKVEPFMENSTLFRLQLGA